MATSFESIVSLQVEAATAAAGGRLGDPPDQSNIGVTIFPTPVVKVFFVHGWNRFASHHDLQKGDNLTFSLVSLSRFLVQIFDNNKVSVNSHQPPPLQEKEELVVATAGGVPKMQMIIINVVVDNSNSNSCSLRGFLDQR